MGSYPTTIWAHVLDTKFCPPDFDMPYPYGTRKRVEAIKVQWDPVRSGESGQAQGRRRRRRILHRRAQTSSSRRQPLQFQAQMICRGGAVPMKSWLEESMERTPMRERMMREPRLHESRT